jgi:hypothetical protein
METTERLRATGSTDRVSIARRALAGVLGVGYIAACIAGAALDSTGGGSDLTLWLLLLGGGGALVLAGSFALASRGALGVALTVIGATAGALALFWSAIAPALAIALIVLSIIGLRRGERR